MKYYVIWANFTRSFKHLRKIMDRDSFLYTVSKLGKLRFNGNISSSLLHCTLSSSSQKRNLYAVCNMQIEIYILFKFLPINSLTQQSSAALAKIHCYVNTWFVKMTPKKVTWIVNITKFNLWFEIQTPPSRFPKNGFINLKVSGSFLCFNVFLT